jgi:NADH dehydrogenase FAD-containing subunit
LPTAGIRSNSEFIPKALLNEKGEVKVDQFLRVKDVENIWAAGDIIDIEPSQIIYADKQANHCVKNLDLVLKGKSPVAYKYGGDRIMGVTLGRNKATGRNGNMKVPSIIIWWIKGRTLGTENLQKYALGTKF